MASADTPGLTAQRPPLAERVDAARSLRESCPADAHAGWEAPAERADPVAVIESQNASRVPELVPIRHGRMIVSPFTFFRGGAAIMAADLAATPAAGLRVQCCGDAHLSNFGLFAAPDRRLVFDLNDFDETLPAPLEWDLKRLAASVVVAARDNAATPKEQRRAARRSVAGYRETIAQAAEMRFLDVWYARIDAERLLEQIEVTQDKRTRKNMRRNVAKAQGRTNLGALEKFTEPDEDGLRIRDSPPLIVRPPAEQAAETERIVLQALEDYGATLPPDRRLVLERYRYVDAARKVVGVGSVGAEAFMVLLIGDRDDDPLFLQVKEATTSVLAPHAGGSVYEHQGERVVQGQRLMQSASDAFLGWVTGTGEQRRQFYVRQLRDMKGSVEIEVMTADGLAGYAWLCGATLARAHARTGDAAAIATYLGEDDAFDRAIARFAIAYADQNEADYAAFEQAAADGRLAVERGV